MSPQEFITTGFVEEINAWLTKLDFATALLPTKLVLVDIDAVYNWKCPSTKKVDEILASIKQDKALILQ